MLPEKCCFILAKWFLRRFLEIDQLETRITNDRSGQN
jgi:hypothetical protein